MSMRLFLGSSMPATRAIVRPPSPGAAYGAGWSRGCAPRPGGAPPCSSCKSFLPKRGPSFLNPSARAEQLPHPISDSAAGQIIRRQLDGHFVAGKYLDVVHAHLARDVREHLVSIVEGDAEHRVRQRFLHAALYFNGIAFRHIRAP